MTKSKSRMELNFKKTGPVNRALNVVRLKVKPDLKSLIKDVKRRLKCLLNKIKVSSVGNIDDDHDHDCSMFGLVQNNYFQVSLPRFASTVSIVLSTFLSSVVNTNLCFLREL